MKAMDLKIEKLIYGGEGLAHQDGSTVFVPFVLPAERVTAAPVERKKKFVRARLERVVEASPERVVPRCPHFGVCGGCDYQHIPYEAQLRYKQEILRETLRRIGKIDWIGDITAHASPPWGYRNRAQWKIRPQESAPATGRGASEERCGIGYFRAHTTALCPVEQCAILSPLLAKTLEALRGALAADEWPGWLREIEAFAGVGDTKLLLTATWDRFPSRAAELPEKMRRLLPELESLLLRDRSRERMALDGPGFVDYEAGGRTYRVGHFSFFQVNRFLVDELIREVAEKDESGSLALDLFAGVGMFAAPLGERFAHVVAVEANPAAVRDCEAIVRPTSHVEVRSADVEQFLGSYQDKPELVVLDPPRTGLTPGAAKHLARIAPARITYVSCEPPTLARDLAILVGAGYEIADFHLFDLFPQTFHMEAVARLRRQP